MNSWNTIFLTLRREIGASKMDISKQFYWQVTYNVGEIEWVLYLANGGQYMLKSSNGISLEP